MCEYPLVSVYTCVYNGARTIHRVFSSMQQLDYPNIEHIIVNDGSTDDTESLVCEYMRSVSYPVKYYAKENGGKHSALNLAWDKAEGEFLIQLDADDELLPHSIKFLVDTYFSIPGEVREEYWCVHGRCVTQNKEFVGEKYPDGINDNGWKTGREIAKQYGGEKTGLQVRRYLSQYKFPEVKGLSHIPEVIIWKQLNLQYGTWYTNEVVRIYYVGEGGNLTAKVSHRRQLAPTCYYYKWKLLHTELYQCSIVDVVKYALFYFITDEYYRKNNGYYVGMRHYGFMLTLLWPFANVAAYIARKKKKLK